MFYRLNPFLFDMLAQKYVFFESLLCLKLGLLLN